MDTGFLAKVIKLIGIDDCKRGEVNIDCNFVGIRERLFTDHLESSLLLLSVPATLLFILLRCTRVHSDQVYVARVVVLLRV